MSLTISINNIYTPSNDIVNREIEGEIIIVPLTAGIGDMEDELYALNETGRAIWQRLDGQKTLQQIADELSAEYGGGAEITQDILGFVSELVKRKILVEKV